MQTWVPLPAFKDNYIWLIINPISRACAVVDPGDAAPVIEYMDAKGLTIEAILLTHHHWDHTSGVEALCKQYNPPVYGPDNSKIAEISHSMGENERLSLKEVGAELQTLTIPGHTLDHIAYFNDDAVFCGDTLFSAGCGRLFEGTAEQMYDSLNKLKGLNNKAKLFPAHEYTVNNLEFALAVEPNNTEIQARLAECMDLRKNNRPTLPTTLTIEKATNPFLRTNETSVQQAASERAEKTITDPIETLRIIREWKDQW